MKTASAKAKGRKLQNHIAGLIRDTFSLDESDVKPAIMGEQGTDIWLSSRAQVKFPFAVECKNQERMNIWNFWKQTEMNAQDKSLCPLLVVKKNRHRILAVLPFEVLLERLSETGDPNE